ncbi:MULTISPECIES: 2-amino-4-hydroxy-6-hydroxymethyldihydropteridine diphosphokinase [Chromohalobacter]|uniref:2-amino-4-hydroxy-6-hydroxymethyldihydropteridine diphosphokinase n=1 Tax=Chromohalobacter canadensis TaxID=141389 RepID=A0ABZ0Y877_9GAMM|nr:MULTISPECIES: 2-amino-4-hydroxy-6-hydroxymethyldihydropteridine diphosphokinase [Chromohalobacter]MCK0752159.1 2-amino-4-hydroxy-6-hydroxymethyldihydropteridine diphosphokinase [Chromohalobacter japonicus]MCK0768478.1 2-amino-4-hydroxy-6-hydroxymethyldihydropteridine diphosphokinase [Chromohalobacter canadensis]WQH08260.1 2-amino-4-hydroxy-6-hydroxymethyldihydropteridine diphosphokinase [Chromohalobacter canadensis]CDQ33516.1 2-amino-4-hydroxy-6-hydroxymethyldihydropteridinepyrophosphokinase
MTQVTVSIGSNIDRERHVLACLDALTDTFGDVQVSRVFESEPVGFEDGRNFYNLVAAFHSTLTVGELQAWCKRVEADNGRLPGSPKFSPRTLDIDLLTVGDRCGHIEGVDLPRDEILQHAFVLRPLAELLPETPHPEVGTSYAALWAAFTNGDQHLWPVSFTWRGRTLSHPD